MKYDEMVKKAIWELEIQAMYNTELLVDNLEEKLEYDNGKYQVYKGQWKMREKYKGDSRMPLKYRRKEEVNVKEGFGVAIYSNKTKYMGFWENDRPHGKGLVLLPCGSIYDGELFKGEPGGYGVKKCTNGEVYQGFYKRGKKNGKGT
jgi:hypothetical protein